MGSNPTYSEVMKIMATTAKNGGAFSSKTGEGNQQNFFGFDMSKMMNPSYYKDLMSSNEMSKFFDINQMQQYFENMKSYNLDTTALFELQQKNISALVEANKKAATGYQDVMKKQLEMFELTMSSIKERMSADPKKATIDSKEASKMAEKMITDMSSLLNSLQKANSEVASIISDRIEKNFYDLKHIVQKAA
jgi:hypothetical protein